MLQYRDYRGLCLISCKDLHRNIVEKTLMGVWSGADEEGREVPGDGWLEERWGNGGGTNGAAGVRGETTAVGMLGQVLLLLVDDDDTTSSLFVG